MVRLSRRTVFGFTTGLFFSFSIPPSKFLTKRRTTKQNLFTPITRSLFKLLVQRTDIALLDVRFQGSMLQGKNYPCIGWNGGVAGWTLLWWTLLMETTKKNDRSHIFYVLGFVCLVSKWCGIDPVCHHT